MIDTTAETAQVEPGPSLSERLSRPTTVLTVGVLTFTLLGFVLGYLINDFAKPDGPRGEFGIVRSIDGPGGPPMVESAKGRRPTMGEVTSVSGNTVSLKTPDGRTVKVNFKSGTRIAVLP